jgi:hypothetical protein
MAYAHDDLERMPEVACFSDTYRNGEAQRSPDQLEHGS